MLVQGKEYKDFAEYKQALREFYAVGNVIHVDYWKQFDKVIDFVETDKSWSVVVQQVKNVDGEWIAVDRIRTHCTAPGKDTVVHTA